MNYTFALVGNPNVGKTSLYNRLTRSAEHVGNWHGVTVDKTSKKAFYTGKDIDIIDLPGFYSLTAYSMEEQISRDEILSGKNDLIIYICEAGNISRNLYLALQLIELNVPMIIVINMIDELHKRGLDINAKKIGEALKVPVFCISAKYGFDGSELLQNALEYAENFKSNSAKLSYLESLPLKEAKEIVGQSVRNSGLMSLYAYIKVLEKDEFVINKLNLSPYQIKKIDELGDTQADVATLRYRLIDEITQGIIVSKKDKKIFAAADKIDKVLLNKFFALPVFLLIMFGIFWLTFGFVGKLFTELLQNSKDVLIARVDARLVATDVPAWINALVCYGIIDGVGSVISFLPQIVLLFFFLALLEDSGYISRLAFMTDGMFRKIGLSGRAVFTIIMGLGCSATAVLTSRGLDDDMMRKKTVIITPFISCSARLPVYTAISAAFFVSSVPIIIGLYVLGGAVAVLLAASMQRTSLKSQETSFIMEMPKYRMPTAERVLQILSNNAKTFLIKVGTVVFGLNVIVWILSNFSLRFGFVLIGSGESIMENIGALLAPVFKPLGFGNWKAVTALMSGIVAKEVVISTVTSLGGVQSVFADSVSALCFLVYTLLYVPCMATLAAVKKEAGVRWMLFGLVLQLSVAYFAALFVRFIAISFAYGVFWGISALAITVAVVVLCIMVSGLCNKKRSCARCFGDCKSCR